MSMEKLSQLREWVEQRETLGIEIISQEQIPRFTKIVSYLEEDQFPDIPRVDKLNPGDMSPYTKEEVLPPEKIYFCGSNWNILNSDLAVGIIGTTSPTSDGARLATLLAHLSIEHGWGKGKEPLVVSGGAYGIDEHAHYGVLDLEGGRTVAVVANPVKYGLHPYEPRRRFLETGVLKYGGLVSEQTEYSEERLPRCLQRNRIISALSDLVVVVECGEISGTVDTAIKAMLQGVPLVVIDWNKIRNTGKWSRPKKEGNDRLLDMQTRYRCVPYRFPENEVENLSELGPLFKEYLERINN